MGWRFWGEGCFLCRLYGIGCSVHITSSCGAAYESYFHLHFHSPACCCIHNLLSLRLLSFSCHNQLSITCKSRLSEPAPRISHVFCSFLIVKQSISILLQGMNYTSCRTGIQYRKGGGLLTVTGSVRPCIFC